MPSHMSTVELVGIVLSLSGVLAVAIVTVKSKLPAATIKIQNQSIQALEQQNAILTKNIQDLTILVEELKNRVSTLETIPLQQMAQQLTAIAEDIKALRTIGEDNNSMLRKS